MAGVRVAARARRQVRASGMPPGPCSMSTTTKVVAGEAGDLREGGREGEEEEAVEGVAVPEAGFEGLRGGGSGGR